MRKIWGFFPSSQLPEGGPMQMSSSILTPCGNANRAHSSQRGNGLLRGWERSLYCRSFSTVVKLASGRLVGIREVVVFPPWKSSCLLWSRAKLRILFRATQPGWIWQVRMGPVEGGGQ